MRVSIAAHAKINLTLDVLGKLPNGYHELLMVMQKHQPARHAFH